MFILDLTCDVAKQKHKKIIWRMIWVWLIFGEHIKVYHKKYDLTFIMQYFVDNEVAKNTTYFMAPHSIILLKLFFNTTNKLNNFTNSMDLFYYLLYIIHSILWRLITLPTCRQTFSFQRMRPMCGFSVVVDIILPSTQSIIYGPSRW